MRRSGLPLIVCGIALMLGAPALAAVTVDVDRDVVQSNESFTLTLTADGGEVGQPDVTGLDTHFDLLGRNQSSSVSIVNGQRRISRRWTYVLLPKAAGTFELPALSVGGVASNRLTIEVREATAAAPGKSDVFFEVTLSRPQTWVQAQVVYTVKLYLGVAVRQTALAEPEILGGDVLVERLGDDRRYEAQVGDRLYNVIERRFALFPQTSGALTVAPIRFTASVWERGRISSRRVYESESLNLAVLPVVAPPASMAGAAWLPASDIEIRAQLRPDDGFLAAGEPATVRLSLTATGLLSAQLPELELSERPGLRVYPDQADLQSRALADRVRSTRQQSFAVIATRGGIFELDDIVLPWFDVDTGEWTVARASLPALRASGSVVVTPADEPRVASTTAAASDAPATASDEAAADANTDIAVREQLFRLKLANYLLLGLWLVTLWLFWRLSSRRRRQRRRQRSERNANAPFRHTQKTLKDVRRACQANDPDAAATALLRWARSYWADAPPASVGEIANRVDDPLRREIEALCRHRYGPAGDPWQGAALAAAMTRAHRAGAEARRTHEAALPQLLPD